VDGLSPSAKPTRRGLDERRTRPMEVNNQGARPSNPREASCLLRVSCVSAALDAPGRNLQVRGVTLS